MEQLKKAFDAARGFKGHSMGDAAEEFDVSRTMLINFFKGFATSAPLEKKIRNYIYKAGIIRSIQKLGLDPDTPIKELQKEAHS